jgi:hypothetical protein
MLLVNYLFGIRNSRTRSEWTRREAGCRYRLYRTSADQRKALNGIAQRHSEPDLAFVTVTA